MTSFHNKIVILSFNDVRAALQAKAHYFVYLANKLIRLVSCNTIIVIEYSSSNECLNLAST